mgnify:CR=1 FL=1
MHSFDRKCHAWDLSVVVFFMTAPHIKGVISAATSAVTAPEGYKLHFVQSTDNENSISPWHAQRSLSLSIEFLLVRSEIESKHAMGE